MKASQLIKNLQKLVEERGDLDLIYSRDDEGNGFQHIYHKPCVGYFEDGDFYQKNEDDYKEDFDSCDMHANVFCIN